MAKRIDDNRLLPCPFCGEDAAIWYFPQHDRPMLKEAYYVGCTNDNCGCELDHPGAFKSLDDAVSAWNRRAKEPTTKNNSSELEKNSKKLEKDFDELDCISRKAALDITWHDPSYSDPLNVLTEVRDKIRELPSVTPQEPRWIPVSERLPEDSGEYLVSVTDKEDEEYKQVGVAWFAHPKDYDIKDGEWRELMINEVVIAWMPLPKPYKAESEET